MKGYVGQERSSHKTFNLLRVTGGLRGGEDNREGDPLRGVSAVMELLGDACQVIVHKLVKGGRGEDGKERAAWGRPKWRPKESSKVSFLVGERAARIPGEKTFFRRSFLSHVGGDHGVGV